MTNKYILYGAPVSLYTGKTRAYLTYKKIPYEEVFSSLSVYKKVIIPKTGVRYIPVLKTPADEYVQDTSAIMDVLEASFPQRSVIPNSPKQRLVSAILEMWGDEWLLIPAMHYRWNHDNFPFIYEEFGKVVLPRMPAFIRRIVGKKISTRFSGYLPMLGINNQSIPAIEDWYENHVLPVLDAHFENHDYLLGGRPCIGDFGLIGPLYTHLLRDPASGKLMKRIAPNVVKWIERMNQDNSELADWLEDDSIPATLNALLKRQFAEFWPVQLGSLASIQQWIKDNPGLKKLPRILGEHDFTIGDATAKCGVRTFSQWKLQRVLDIYQNFTSEEKKSVDPMLVELGGFEVMQTTISKRVTRENNKLVVEQHS